MDWVWYFYCFLVMVHCGLDEQARASSFHGYNEIPQQCGDKHNECQNWAKNAECVRNPYFMREECRKSCPLLDCKNGIQKEWGGSATDYYTRYFASKLPNTPAYAPKHFKVDVAMGEFTEPGHRLRGMPWLTLSSIGIGTYLGAEDAATDSQVAAAIVKAVTTGINVIDTASNYRHGRAEKSVGDALYSLFNDNSKYGFKREMLFISTKAGFISNDIAGKLVKEGKIGETDIVSGINCIHPACIIASLDHSLISMHIKTVDLLYLHNAAEVQLPVLGRTQFMNRLKTAFITLEELRSKNKIRAYGMATWACFRSPPNSEQHLSLQAVVELAQQVGGINHGFRYIQIPINFGMPEAWKERWQITANQTYSSSLWVAAMNNVGVFGSGPLGEASLLKDEKTISAVQQINQLSGVSGTGSKLLQLARSTPGIVASLVGMKGQNHVDENLMLNFLNPIDIDEMTLMYTQIYGAQ